MYINELDDLIQLDESDHYKYHALKFSVLGERIKQIHSWSEHEYDIYGSRAIHKAYIDFIKPPQK